MEPYPLADAPPPRYAVESDDEDEYNPLSAPASSDQPPVVEVEFKSIYDIPLNRPLIFASSEAGVSWAKIVNLGEQRAGIYVNKLPVGLLFSPSWTNAVTVVSEAETRTRLPLFAMTAYTTAVIKRLQPTSVAILDSYPIQVYVSPQVISRENAPIRYLSVGKNPVSDPELELFAPPNLLQSTAASLLNQLFLRSASEEGLATDTTAIVLLPSSKVRPHPPMTFDSKGTTGDFEASSWAREALEKTHKWLFEIIGQGVGESSLQARTESVAKPLVLARTTRASLGEIGEGGMYI